MTLLQSAPAIDDFALRHNLVTFAPRLERYALVQEGKKARSGNLALSRELAKIAVEDSDSLVREVAAQGLLELFAPRLLDAYAGQIGRAARRYGTRQLVLLYGLVPSVNPGDLRDWVRELNMDYYGGSLARDAVLARHGDQEAEKRLLAQFDAPTDQAAKNKVLLLEMLAYTGAEGIRKQLISQLSSDDPVSLGPGSNVSRRKLCAYALSLMLLDVEDFPVKDPQLVCSDQDFARLKAWCQDYVTGKPANKATGVTENRVGAGKGTPPGGTVEKRTVRVVPSWAVWGISLVPPVVLATIVFLWRTRRKYQAQRPGPSRGVKSDALLSATIAGGGFLLIFLTSGLWGERTVDVHIPPAPPSGERSQVQADVPVKKPVEEIPANVKARLDELRYVARKDLHPLVAKWDALKGHERIILWEVVRLGAAPEQDRDMRVRVCTLAREISVRKSVKAPAPYCDPESVEPLLSCLRSRDPELVSLAASALGSMSEGGRRLHIREKALPELRKLFGADDPGLARAAMTMALSLDAFELAPDLAAAWQRHAKSPECAGESKAVLRGLLETKVFREVATEHPEYDLPDEASEIDMAKAGAKLAALARPKCAALADALGEDPAKWKEYWERTLAEKQPVPAKEP